jgi:hypothetical protein
MNYYLTTQGKLGVVFCFKGTVFHPIFKPKLRLSVTWTAQLSIYPLILYFEFFKKKALKKRALHVKFKQIT